MSALEPGLYRATVRGVPDVIVMVGKHGDYARIVNADTTLMAFQDSPKDITDARPLIILDTNALSARNIAQILRSSGYAGVADQIEAQTKPARIPEPMRWGSKVRTARATYVLLDIATLGRRWLDEHDGQLYKWDALADPTLIREGVS